MNWDYANLSKAAKEAGGPEKLVNVLIESGKQVGRKEMYLPIVAALGLGAAGYALLNRLIDYFKEKGEISEIEVEKAKEKLIQGINDYDANNQDNQKEKNENY